MVEGTILAIEFMNVNTELHILPSPVQNQEHPEETGPLLRLQQRSRILSCKKAFYHNKDHLHDGCRITCSALLNPHNKEVNR